MVREIGLQLAKHQNKRTLIADSAHLESLGTGDLDFIEEAARRASRHRLCMINLSGRDRQEGAVHIGWRTPSFAKTACKSWGSFSTTSWWIVRPFRCPRQWSVWPRW